MRFVVPIMLALAPLSAQPPADPYAAARAAMERSVAKQVESAHRAMDASLAAQRRSVQRQAETARQVEAGAADHEFYTIPWPKPVQPLASPDCDPLPPGQMDNYIQEAAQREGLTPDLLRAVIDKESGYRPCVVSPKGAQGLMQLMPATAGQLNVQDPFDPKQNIDGGTRLLKMLLTRYNNDLSLALGAYNAGPGAVDRYGGIPPFPETVNYVSDILDRIR